MAPITDASPMPFGRYRGVRMEDVPVTYIDWVQKQDWLADWPGVADWIQRNKALIDEAKAVQVTLKSATKRNPVAVSETHRKFAIQ
jgi:hypothetical protein